MTKKIGLCFSRKFEGNAPLDHIGPKKPVYLRLLEKCQEKGWEVFVLTRRTYLHNGIFKGSWRFEKGKFRKVDEEVKIDLVFDRTGGTKFPLEGDTGLRVVNERRFKLLCWDKWQGYAEIGKFMPGTYWVGQKENLPSILGKIKTKWVVLKPYNGLKGIGVFVGSKKEALAFDFSEKYPLYLAQEFVDTKGGIPGVVEGLHDLRVVIVNGKVVWSHVRTPPPGSFKANVAGGGRIRELDYQKDVPTQVGKIVDEVARGFSRKFDNPLYSLDFGMEGERAKIFEINDQVGFPTWEMSSREDFLDGLIENFESKMEE